MAQIEYLLDGIAYCVIGACFWTWMSYGIGNRFVIAAIITQITESYEARFHDAAAAKAATNAGIKFLGFSTLAFIFSCAADHLADYFVGHRGAPRIIAVIESAVSVATAAIVLVATFIFRAAAMRVRETYRRAGGDLIFWHRRLR